jgi:hypothetical protein
MRLQRRFQDLLTHAADAKDVAVSLKRMLWRRSSLISASPVRTVLGLLFAMDWSSIASLRAFFLSLNRFFWCSCVFQQGKYFPNQTRGQFGKWVSVIQLRAPWGVQVSAIRTFASIPGGWIYYWLFAFFFFFLSRVLVILRVFFFFFFLFFIKHTNFFCLT